jgi:hypothetical protein
MMLLLCHSLVRSKLYSASEVEILWLKPVPIVLYNPRLKPWVNEKLQKALAKVVMMNKELIVQECDATEA